jgi:transmembrane sensor
MRWPFVSRRERLRRRAADWVALLNGPHSEADRAEFEQWIAGSPDHAAAYDRLSSLFETAGRAARPARVSSLPTEPAPRRPSRPLRYAFAAAAACAALLAFFILSARTTLPLIDAPRQSAVYLAEGAESRAIRLPDGSEVVLAPGGRLEVALGAGERRLRLTRGEAHFSVAHESRPFIVAAEGTEVLARGTQFVVRLTPGRTTVALIEGQVDVSYAPAADHSDQRRVARLRPGEQLVVETRRSSAESAPQTPAGPVVHRRQERNTRNSMLEFNDTPLAEAVEQANHHGTPRIRLGHAALADLRLTGAFRSGDTRGFAESVAAAFALRIDRDPDGTLWLRPVSTLRGEN